MCHKVPNLENRVLPFFFRPPCVCLFDVQFILLCWILCCINSCFPCTTYNDAYFFFFFTVRMYQHHASQSYIWNQQKPVLYIIASSQLYIVYIYSIYVRRTPPCAHHIRYYRTLYYNRYYITYTYMYEQLIWLYNVYLHLRTADIATIQTYISYCYYLTIRNTYSKQL